MGLRWSGSVLLFAVVGRVAAQETAASGTNPLAVLLLLALMLGGVVWLGWWFWSRRRKNETGVDKKLDQTLPQYEMRREKMPEPTPPPPQTAPLKKKQRKPDVPKDTQPRPPHRSAAPPMPAPAPGYAEEETGETEEALELDDAAEIDEEAPVAVGLDDLSPPDEEEITLEDAEPEPESEMPDWLSDPGPSAIDEPDTLLGGAPPEPSADEPATEPLSLKETHFTAYYPRTACVDQKHGLYVYAMLKDDEIKAAVEADVSRFKAELGGEVPKPREAKQTVPLAHGTPITVMPESDDLEFEPAAITKRWRGSWTQFAFDFYPPEALANDEAFVRVSVLVAGVEIAHIRAGIEVLPAEEAPAPPEDPTPTAANLPENPLLAQKLQAQTVTPYQSIFISYSRKDTRIARQYKLAQQALGNDVFLDVDNLRAGENWQAALARAIDKADIFQLFWSQHSAASQYCRYEWEYALQARCRDATCEGFIRPVYWEKPMPGVPETLGKLNFKFVPFAASGDGIGGSSHPGTVYHIGDVTGGNVIIGGEADIHGDANIDDQT